jgi:hypothetical protein
MFQNQIYLSPDPTQSGLTHNMVMVCRHDNPVEKLGVSLIFEVNKCSLSEKIKPKALPKGLT